MRNQVTVTPLSLGTKGEGGAITHFLAELVLAPVGTFVRDTSEAAVLAATQTPRVEESVTHPAPPPSMSRAIMDPRRGTLH